MDGLRKEGSGTSPGRSGRFWDVSGTLRKALGRLQEALGRLRDAPEGFGSTKIVSWTSSEGAGSTKIVF